jgi:hypothetical protein
MIPFSRASFFFTILNISVRDVQALHLRGVLEEDFADLFVEAVLTIISSVITFPMASITRGPESSSSLPAAVRVLTILREMYSISSEVSRIQTLSIAESRGRPDVAAVLSSRPPCPSAW